MVKVITIVRPYFPSTDGDIIYVAVETPLKDARGDRTEFHRGASTCSRNTKVSLNICSVCM